MTVRVTPVSLLPLGSRETTRRASTFAGPLAERGATRVELGADTCHFFPGLPLGGSLASEALASALDAFFLRSFTGRWRSDTFAALAAGMRGEDLALLRDESSGAVVGFARIYDGASPALGPGMYWRELMGSSPGALGPIGVDEGRRGLGLGLALLRLCLEELARRGVRTMVIDWTDLGAFYAKMGFKSWKRYRLCSKLLARTKAS